MKKIQADISMLSIVFWLIVVVCSYILILNSDLPIWLIGFVPIGFVIQTLIFKMSNYRIVEDELVVNQSFKKTRIELEKIKSYEIKEHSILKQILTGFPKRAIAIKYNKYDSIIILTANPEILTALANR
jgi:hypothetical protein